MRDPLATAKAILEQEMSDKEKVKAEMMAMKEAMTQHMTDEGASDADIKAKMEEMDKLGYVGMKEMMEKEGVEYETYVSEDVGTATGSAKELKLASVNAPNTSKADLDADIKTSAGAKKTKKTDAGKISKSDADDEVVDDKKDLPMKEDLDALFSGEELSEDFKSKATTIFEAAIALRTRQIQEQVEQEYLEMYEASKEEFRTELSSKLDDYLSYVVEEWMKDNEIAIERGLRGDIAESFITGLKGLFEEHYITVPEEKYDILEGLTEKVEQLEKSLNEEITKNIELRKDGMVSRCINIFNEATIGLSDSEIEKLKSLAEGLEYDSEDQFRDKITVLRENYFNDTNETNELATEIVGETITEEVEESTNSLTESMKFYSEMLTRSAHVQKQTNSRG